MEQNELLKKYTKNNKFNKVIIQNAYYIYAFLNQ